MKTNHLPLSKIARLAQMPEAELLQSMKQAELITFNPETQHWEITPLGYELEVQVLHSPIRDIILLPEDFTPLIHYLQQSTPSP